MSKYDGHTEAEMALDAAELFARAVIAQLRGMGQAAYNERLAALWRGDVDANEIETEAFDNLALELERRIVDGD